MTNAAFFWLIALPLLASPLVYLIGRVNILLNANATQNKTRPPRFASVSVARWAALLALLATWIPLTFAARQFNASGSMFTMVESVAVQFDGLSMLLAVVALGLGTLVTLFSVPYMAGEQGEEKYYAMLLTMIGVMMALGCAGDLFNLWIWFEAMAVSSYLMVVFYRQQPASLEAGIKYVVQSAAGSVLILIGIALVFSQTGSLSLADIHRAVRLSPITLAAGTLFIIGFGVKAALVPLHTWLPDAHTQAPIAINAMHSGVAIETALIALLRVIAALSGPQSYPPTVWGTLLMFFGALNMVVGNLMALRQTQVKRLLAYSSLSHMGYMVTGMGIAFYAGEMAGAQGGFFHIVTHSMMKGLAFLAIGALMYATGRSETTQVDSQSNPGPLTIKDLDGAAQRYPLVALTLSLAILSLAGLPPLAGFMSKWQIFVAGINTQNFVIGLLILFAALNSVLSLAFYAPLVSAVYRNQPSPAVQQGTPLPRVMNIPLILLAAGIVLLGIWPGLVDWLIGPAGSALLAAIGK